MNQAPIIKTSRNYKEFSYLPGNRSVTKDHKSLLDRLIQQQNQLHCQPLTIGLLPDGRKVIIDGQHRFQISEERNFTIYYMEVSCKDEAEARELASILNAGKKGWNITNHVSMHSANGNLSYQRLMELCKETGYDLRNILTIFNGGKRKGTSGLQEIKLGHLTLDQEAINKIKDYVEKVKIVSDIIRDRWESKGKKITFLQSNAFVTATLRVIKTPNLEFSTLLKKLDAADVVKETTIERYIKQYETIYNSGKRTKMLMMSRV